MKNILLRILDWWRSVCAVAWSELKQVRADEGVITYFVILCLTYPVLYSLIYNPETVHDVRVVVVDDCRTATTRNLVREMDATSEVAIAGYAANMQEARDAMARKECYGILYIPSNFDEAMGRGEQAHLSLYADMGVLVRYKQLLTALTNVSSDIGAKLTATKIAPFIYQEGSIIESNQVPMGNTGMGLASAVLPIILAFVLQQSLILGAAMLNAGRIERRKRNCGVDPRGVDAGVFATVLGRSLCYMVIYYMLVAYVWLAVPRFFDFPQNAGFIEIMLLALPFILACTLMAQVMQMFVTEREQSFLVIAFSSVVFVFLSGVSWPRYAMSPLWTFFGDCIPGTWASNAYVLMQSNGATLSLVSHHLYMLWILVAVYGVLAYVTERWVVRRRFKRMRNYGAQDPDELMRYEMHRNGVDIVYDDDDDEVADEKADAVVVPDAGTATGSLATND